MVAKLMDKLENEYHMIKYNKNTHEIAIIHWAKYNMNKLGGKPIMDCISSELKKVQDVSLLKIILEDVAKEKVRALFLKEIKEREGREKNKDDDLYEKPSEEELRKVRQLHLHHVFIFIKITINLNTNLISIPASYTHRSLINIPPCCNLPIGKNIKMLGYT